MTDTELVQRIRSNDPEGFRELLRLYADDLYGLAFSLLGNAADAEDVVQQSCLGALNGIGRFEGRSSLRTWLSTIVANQALKTRRSKRVRQATSLDAGNAAGSGNGSGTDSSSSTPEVRSSTAAVESRLDLTMMLDALSAEHREVIVLRELQQFTYEEIAETLGIPRGTVESRLFRARRALRERFAKEME